MLGIGNFFSKKNNFWNDTFINIFLKIIILLGISLTIIQFGFNRSFWLDESNLVYNIQTRNFLELLKPLDRVQVAPIGFIILTKINTILFGQSEYIFRLIPFICYLLSVLYLNKSIQFFSLNKTFNLLFLACCTLNIKIIEYATEFKQYSVDLFISIFLVYQLLNYLNSNKNKDFLYLIIASIISIWFSFISVFIITSIFLILLINKIKLQKLLLFIFPYISFLVYYLLFIQNHPSKEIQDTAWIYNYMPLNIFSSDFYKFFYLSYKKYIYSFFGFGKFWFFPIPFILFGVYSLITKKQYKILFIFITPVIIHLFVSSLKLYPFDGRLILYLLPNHLFLFIFGIYQFQQFFITQTKIKNIFIITFTLFLFTPILIKYPINKEDNRKAIQYLSQNSSENDYLYLYYSSVDSYLYYSKIFNLKTKNITYGTENRNNWNNYLQEINLNNDSLWILFSHNYPIKSNFTEQDSIMNYIRNKNYIINIEKHYKDTDLYKLTKNKLVN